MVQRITIEALSFPTDTRGLVLEPMGPEDLSYWPSTDRFWSVSEHPHRRWVFSMKRSFFD